MPVFLGLDLGEKRVGISQSDETGTIAEAIDTVTYSAKGELLKKLRAYVERTRPEKIVVGLPQTLRGETGPQARRIMELVDWLKTNLEGDWVLWDERLTTVEAERVLLLADMSRSKRKSLRDRIAAQRILQSYLDARKNV